MKRVKIEYLDLSGNVYKSKVLMQLSDESDGNVVIGNTNTSLQIFTHANESSDEIDFVCGDSNIQVTDLLTWITGGNNVRLRIPGQDIILDSTLENRALSYNTSPTANHTSNYQCGFQPLDIPPRSYIDNVGFGYTTKNFYLGSEQPNYYWNLKSTFLNGGNFCLELEYRFNHTDSFSVDLFQHFGYTTSGGNYNGIVSFDTFTDIVTYQPSTIEIPGSWNIPKFANDSSGHTYSFLGFNVGEGSVYRNSNGYGSEMYLSSSNKFTSISNSSPLNITITPTSSTSVLMGRTLTLTGTIRRYS